MEEKKRIKIDVRGETCPVPLVETRKAIKKAVKGDTIQVIGDHPSSKQEIPMAVESLGLELVDIEEKEGEWKIIIRIQGGEDG
ncbi:MAG: sulfurtransferase TusA family protein [Thermoplasmata archaeon]